MLDAVLDAVVAALTASGVSAVRQFPDSEIDRDSGPVVCVGLKSNKLVSAGAGDYMGERTDGGVVSEVYGFRMSPVIALDIYSPADGENGAEGCVSAAEAISSALSEFPSGLKSRELVCGQTKFDGTTEMFHMPVELNCAAFLIREMNGETGEFTDFVLKGVLS
ncbi:MAG: hypothetical protein EOM54_04150 [Clostridia bacterium]|nr:hypothetical protein [Clostridia bacterium]